MTANVSWVFEQLMPRASLKHRLLIVLLALIALVLMGCAPHQIYRSDIQDNCVSRMPERDCQMNALQQYEDPAQPDAAYWLGFIEFDDQGQLFDRRQMRAVIDHLYKQAATQDLLMVVFVHGWKHSAAPGDDNIQNFRESLKRLSELESTISRQSGIPARQVAGVYLGWRGGSITWPWVKELTFWERKNTAHKVGQGGATEVLNRIDLVKKSKDSTAGSGVSRTRLVVIGHSFGGAVVYSAVSQILANRFVHTVGPSGQVSDIEGFGNLVVLINPAFEALRFAPLSDMSTERGTYFAPQLPVLAVLTSEADDATKKAFPFGRWFSTLFEKERLSTRHNGASGETEQIDQSRANRTVVGHFEPYRTHTLRATDEESAELSLTRAMETFAAVSQSWETDTPGSRIPFEGSVLERNLTSAGKNPYLIIQADGELIPDHNAIYDPRVESFIRQLILVSSQSENLQTRQQLRMSLPVK